MRRRPRRSVVLVVAIAALASAAILVAVGARGHRATGDYASFKQCPLGDPATDLCLFSRTQGGAFVVGDTTVPIAKTITLQGGVHVVENEEKEILQDKFIAAGNGATLSRTPQVVPGGLRAVVDPKRLPPRLRAAFYELLAREATAVTATIELAAPASSIGIDVQNLVEAQGTALTLPVKIRLSNALLGGSCSIGSDAKPISLPLTTGELDPAGANRPIKGKVGKAKLEDDYNLTVIGGSSLVNDAFAAPRVEGCGAMPREHVAVDRAVDAALGLPVAAGHNETILNGAVQDANAAAVRASR
jgi:hypothetical protein